MAQTLRCSFCGRTRDQVNKLVCGPTVVRSPEERAAIDRLSDDERYELLNKDKGVPALICSDCAEAIVSGNH